MSDLNGKKIAVLIESQYNAKEIRTYVDGFKALGAQVDLMSRLWGEDSLEFVSEVEEKDEKPQTLTVNIDFKDIDLKNYAAVIMAANYPSVRLRWLDDKDLGEEPLHGGSGRKAPAVQFFYDAMMDTSVIKAFPCHGLWILTPIPEVLAGRRVTCNRGDVGRC